jgi:hypothetical protein
MCLPNDNPIPVGTVLTGKTCILFFQRALKLFVMIEPEDEDLNKERAYWREKSRDSFRRAVLSRGDMISHIRPFLQDANTTSSSPCMNGTFDNDDTTTTTTPVDPLVSQHMEKEFKDSMGLVEGLLKDLPERVAAFDEIETILTKLETIK